MNPQRGGGPLGVERSVTLEIFQLTDGKRLSSLEVYSRCRLLDVSPDGSHYLTGDWLRTQESHYARLDVWALQLGRHAAGWEPVPPTATDEAVTTWAAFVDKPRVLTLAADRLMLWTLPECRAEYMIAGFGSLVALSPGRKYVAGFRAGRGLEIYRTESGTLAGTLPWPGQVRFPTDARWTLTKSLADQGLARGTLDSSLPFGDAWRYFLCHQPASAG